MYIQIYNVVKFNSDFASEILHWICVINVQNTEGDSTHQQINEPYIYSVFWAEKGNVKNKPWHNY